MTQTVSAQSLADINTNASTLEVSLDGKGIRAGLSQSARLTLRELSSLKDVLNSGLGQDAKDVRLVLEQHTPEADDSVREGDDCHNSWHIVGLQSTRNLNSLYAAAGVNPPSTQNGVVYHNSEDIKLLITASELQLKHDRPKGGFLHKY